MTRWRDSGWSIVPIIAMVLIVYLVAAWLTGCATVAERQIHLSFPTCEGAQRGLGLTIRTNPFPAAECARLAAELSGPLAGVVVALESHLACATWSGDRRQAIIVLPPGAPRWMITHELARVIDEDQRRLRPWGQAPQECPT